MVARRSGFQFGKNDLTDTLKPGSSGEVSRSVSSGLPAILSLPLLGQ
jgi:hypothetical protein